MKYALIVSTILLSALLGQAVHEFGHAVHAWTSGGRVTAIELVPHRFSSTAVFPNPHPLWVVWGGPIWGCVIPLAIVGVAWRWLPGVVYLARFFAGFCLVGNGAYIGVGWLIRAGDAGDLVRLGCPVWLMVAFGIVAFSGGITLWNGNGKRFGLGAGRESISRRHAIGAAAGLAIVVALEYALHVWLLAD